LAVRQIDLDSNSVLSTRQYRRENGPYLNDPAGAVWLARTRTLIAAAAGGILAIDPETAERVLLSF
jgi:hypothetical protein